MRVILKKNNLVIITMCDNWVKTKYFAGNYEQEIVDGSIRELHYIAGPMGLAAIYVKNNGADSMYYTHTDHLGSITEVTNQNGILMQRMAYNAWGVRELLVNNISATYPSFMFDRGYTGHEHLDAFNLINMNGRLYDPILGRMLSPDNFAQSSTQGLNHYSYAMNNPMVYTDPDGEFIQYIFGAIIGGISGYSIADALGYEGWDKFWYTLGGAAIGAATAGIGTAVSSSAGVAAGGFVGGAAGGAGFGTMSGYASGLRGGDLFNAGFQGALIGGISGLYGGAYGSAIGGARGAFVGGVVSGGISTALYGGTGEDIIKSAAVGGITSFGLYHVQSYIDYRTLDGEPSYRQFLGMSRDFQRSAALGKEFGGKLLEGGGYRSFPGKYSQKSGIDLPDDYDFTGVKDIYHSHYREPRDRFQTGEYSFTEISKYHDPADTRRAVTWQRNSYLINKYDMEWYHWSTGQRTIYTGNINRYPYYYSIY